MKIAVFDTTTQTGRERLEEFNKRNLTIHKIRTVFYGTPTGSAVWHLVTVVYDEPIVGDGDAPLTV